MAIFEILVFLRRFSLLSLRSPSCASSGLGFAFVFLNGLSLSSVRIPLVPQFLCVEGLGFGCGSAALCSSAKSAANLVSNYDNFGNYGNFGNLR